MSKPFPSPIKHVLLDIEGTICPISFVKETLFPYALTALPEVAKTKWDDPNFITYRDAFPQEHRESPEKLVAHVEDLTKRDVKIAYLKNLQGYLWQSGYEDGAYATPLFEDVVRNLRKWEKGGVKVSVYSSGSVFAQKLLFAHVKDDVEGDGGGAPNAQEKKNSIIDLRDLVTEWFDTTNAGSKLEWESYEKIAAVLELQPKEILFLSDAVGEVAAARETGIEVRVVVRKGNKELTFGEKEEFDEVESFDEIEGVVPEAEDHAGNANAGDKRKRSETEPVEGDPEGLEPDLPQASTDDKAALPKSKVPKTSTGDQANGVS